MAVNFIDVCVSIVGLAGVTVIDTSLTVDTVSFVEAEMVPIDAVMVVLPIATLLAKPVLSIVAVPAADVVHKTVLVTSCVELSLNAPVAVNCFVAPAGIVLFKGAIASDNSVALVTVAESVPDIAPAVAVIVVVPAATAWPSPLTSTVITLVALDDHVTDVSSCVLPSLKMPVAVNCCCVPGAKEGLAGVTVIESRLAGTTVIVEESVNAPTVAVMVVVPPPNVVAKPLLSTLATLGSEEFHVTPLTRS